jgi:hypothetical protein
MHILYRFVMIMCSIMLLAACGKTAPIENVTTPISPVQGISSNDVRTAIVAGAATRGWVVRDISSVEMEGILKLRSHTAVVSIAYDEKHYAITYKSSSNLKAKDGKIHKNYNGWIKNLEQSINLELMKIKNK